MSDSMGKTKSHVYVKGSVEAVKLYKEAFNLDEKAGERIMV